MALACAAEVPVVTARYPDDVRERALEVMRVDGLSAAHAATGVPKSTLSRWAAAGRVDLGSQTVRTRSAAQARAAQLETTTVGRLEQIVELSTRSLVRFLEANAELSELDEDDLGVWSDELGRFVPADNEAAAAALRRQQLLTSSGVPLRDLSQTLTRAVHDLELLRGHATERAQMVVEFNIPRPEPATIVVVDQADIAAQPRPAAMAAQNARDETLGTLRGDA